MVLESFTCGVSPRASSCLRRRGLAAISQAIFLDHQGRQATTTHQSGGDLANSAIPIGGRFGKPAIPIGGRFGNASGVRRSVQSICSRINNRPVGRPRRLDFLRFLLQDRMETFLVRNEPGGQANLVKRAISNRSPAMLRRGSGIVSEMTASDKEMHLASQSFFQQPKTIVKGA